MKKASLILGLLLLFYSNTHAVEVEYSIPTFDDINQNLTTVDIEPGYNPQPAYRIGIYQPYENQGVAELTATAFCSTFGYSYINHTLENEKVQLFGALYYPTSNTWWDYHKNIKRFSAITCDDGNVDAGSGTGSTFIINNIDSDQGINKKIFDIETITEIYQYEALIMVFILLYTFFMRVIGARQKKQKVLGL